MSPRRRLCALGLATGASWALVALVIAAALVLAGCATREKPRPVEVRTQTVEVAVRAPCPAPEMREQLRALRPKPLRAQPKPETALEKAAAVVAQLLLYEGEGGWADRVDATLDRCQQP